MRLARRPAPANPVRISQDGEQISVETGAATFVVGGDPGALFDAIRLPNGATLVDGGALTARVDGTDVAHPTTRRVVEHAGPLTAIVVVEGLYDRPPVGNDALSSRRRYVFTAGSPTAIVRHAVAWEGDLCPSDAWDLACDTDGDGEAEVNALLVERVRNGLALEPAASREILAVREVDAPAVG